jgi:endonuclease-3 related protein
LFNQLLNNFGNQNWWPAETPFEVMVGAILTQQTSWKNVERSIINLKMSSELSPSFLKSISIEKLEQLINSSGFYKTKSKTLKRFVDFIFESYRGDIEQMKHVCSYVLRKQLTSIKGVGKETADSMMLYALDKAIFPVDAYTKRIYSRFGIKSSEDYEELRILSETALARDGNALSNFKEMHALLVELGKDYCNKKPKCNFCPINNFCQKKGVQNEQYSHS